MVFTEATKKGSDVGDVVGGVGVEDDDVVEVRGDAFQAFGDLVNDLNEPIGGGTAALRHHKPLEESVWRAKRRQWDGILVDGDFGGTRRPSRRGRKCALFPMHQGPRRRGRWEAFRGS